MVNCVWKVPALRVQVEIAEVIAKMSYRDLRVIQHVLAGSIARLAESLTHDLIPTTTATATTAVEKRAC